MTKILNSLKVVGTGSSNEAIGITGGYLSSIDIRLPQGISYSSGNYTLAVRNSTTGRLEQINTSDLPIPPQINYVNQGTVNNIAYYSGATAISSTSSISFTASTLRFSGLTGISITSTSSFGPSVLLDINPSTSSSTIRVRNINSSLADVINISGNGNIGIGTNSASTNLHIYSTQPGAFRLVDTTQGNGKILVSDTNGVASWTTSNTFVFGVGLTSNGIYPTYVQSNLRTYSGLTLSSGIGINPDSIGLGLTFNNGIINTDTQIISTTSSFIVDESQFGYLFKVTTGPSLIIASVSSITTNGFEFTIMKEDSDIGVILVDKSGTYIKETYGSSINSVVKRQYQSVKYKYDGSYWYPQIIDEGLVPPMTVMVNIGPTNSHTEEFPIVDLNDPVQKAMNYTQGGSNNDWISGCIYSSIRPIYTTGGSLFNLNTGEYIGDTTIPAYGVSEGKSFRITMSGTMSNTSGGTIDLTSTFGGANLFTNTLSLDSSLDNKPWRLQIDIKIMAVGSSGEVYATGHWFSPDSTVDGNVLLWDKTTTIMGLDTTSSMLVDVSYSPAADNYLTILSSMIERIA